MERDTKEKRLAELDRKIRIHRRKKRQLYMRVGIPAGILTLALCIFLGVRVAGAIKTHPGSSGSPAGDTSSASPGSSADAGDVSGEGEHSGTAGTSDGSSSPGETDSFAETETEFPETQITVSLMGDCTLGTDVNFNQQTSLNAYYQTRGADYFFQNVKSILEADDLSIVNMEGTLTTSETRADKLFAFKADPEYAQILVSGSVEAANLANNHSMDYGEQSYTDTISALENAGITTFGHDRTSVLDIKGVKVGLVGIYELDIHMDCQTQLLENIQKVKDEGAQLILVIMHWGNEKETIPDSNQIALGHLAIDNGADLVVGHHPHVLQGIEHYKGKYIAYSLGNFCFGGNTNPVELDTIIFQQTFTVTAAGVQKDENINIIPCSVSSEAYYNNYQPTPAEGEEAERILQKLEERTNNVILG